MGGKRLNIQPAEKYGKWTVLSSGHKLTNRRGTFCYCVCECGTVDFISSSSLVRGRSRGCRHCVPHMHKGHLENWSHSRLYNVWHSMRNRCNNPNDPAYCNYGGRGITICDEWQNDFFAFRDWALAHGCDDEDGLTLDRIDNDGNYCPENCKWSTHIEQSNNKRNCVYLTYNGKTQTMSQWAREIGITVSTLDGRLRKMKWSVEKALTEPLNEKFSPTKRKEVTSNG